MKHLYALLLAASSFLIASVTGCNTPVEVPKVTIPDFFALNCPGRTEHFANVDTVLIIGHRGAPLLEVENTLPSFQRGIAEGANCLELDFCMTADGQIVVWHDWSPNDPIALARESGAEVGSKVRPRFPPIGSDLRRPIHELSYADFTANYWYSTKNLIDRQRVDAEIPTFEKWLAWAAQQKLYYVFLDMKLPADRPDLATIMITRMDSAISAAHTTWRPVYITPRQTIWQAFAEAIHGTGLALDVDLGGGLVDNDYCRIASSSYAHQRGSGFATTMHPFQWTESPWTTLKNLLTCDLVMRDAPRAEGEPAIIEKVVAATIDDEEKMQCLLELGIDGMMTNQAALLKAVALRLGKQV